MRRILHILQFSLLIFCVAGNLIKRNDFNIPHAVLPLAASGIPQSIPIDEEIRNRPEPTSPPLPPVEKSIDLDGDGNLSLTEIQYAAFVHHGLSGTVVERMFNDADKNRDGYLNSHEFDALRVMVLETAENAALRYLKNVDKDGDRLLSLPEAQKYMLKEYGIGARDVERIWLLVVPSIDIKMDAAQFSKLRRRIRGMTIRLARQMMKKVDVNGDGHISIDEAQAIAFEQEGIGAGDVSQMLMSVDDNNDGELNAPEFADFERIVRARAVETSKKALKVVDADNSDSLTMDEAKKIAFEHYGFDEKTLGPFFDQADENEDGQLDYVEFAGFRSVIRAKAVSLAIEVLKQIDYDGDGLINLEEAADKTKREDDMEPSETEMLFNIADQNKSEKLDKVELADFLRLVRLSAIKFATDHLKEFDADKNRVVSLEELATLIETKYSVPLAITKIYFDKSDVDGNGDLGPGEIVDFRHEIRNYVAERNAQEKVSSSEEEIFSTIAPPGTSTVRTIKRVTSTSAAPQPVASTPRNVAPTAPLAKAAPIVSRARALPVSPSVIDIARAPQGPQIVDARIALHDKTTTPSTITSHAKFPTLAPDPHTIPPIIPGHFTIRSPVQPPKTSSSPPPRLNKITPSVHKSPLTSAEFEKLPFIKPSAVPLNNSLKIQRLSSQKQNKSPNRHLTRRLPSSESAETTITLEKIMPQSPPPMKSSYQNSPDVVEYEYIEVEIDENGNEVSRKVENKKKKLSDAQKKELGIPVEEEIVYLDDDGSSSQKSSSTTAPIEYETIIEYVDETEPENKSNEKNQRSNRGDKRSFS